MYETRDYFAHLGYGAMSLFQEEIIRGHSNFCFGNKNLPVPYCHEYCTVPYSKKLSCKKKTLKAVFEKNWRVTNQTTKGPSKNYGVSRPGLGDFTPCKKTLRPLILLKKVIGPFCLKKSLRPSFSLWKKSLSPFLHHEVYPPRCLPDWPRFR